MLWVNHDINQIIIELAPSGLTTTFTASLMPLGSPSSFDTFKTFNTTRKGFIAFLFIMSIFLFISFLDFVH